MTKRERRVQAAAIGISVQTLYRRLAEEKAGTAEWLGYPEPEMIPAGLMLDVAEGGEWPGPEEEPEPEPEPPRPGPEALPYVPLVSAESRGLHYRLDVDGESVLPDCPFRIARGRGRGWTIAHRDDRYGDRPGDPTPSRRKFRPHGIGRKKNRVAIP